MRPRSPSRRRPRNEAPESAAALINQVIARIGGEGRGLEQRIYAVWDDAVGPMLAKRARPEGVRGRTLVVRVESSALAHEIALLRRQILDRLGRALGQDALDDLRTRVGGGLS
jgi:hypothetical protein